MESTYPVSASTRGLQRDVKQAITDNGDRERFYDRIHKLLVEKLRLSGWYENTHNLCITKLRASDPNTNSPMNHAEHGADIHLNPHPRQSVVTNYNTLYSSVEREAWENVSDEVKEQVMGEIRKMLLALLVQGS